MHIYVVTPYVHVCLVRSRNTLFFHGSTDSSNSVVDVSVAEHLPEDIPIGQLLFFCATLVSIAFNWAESFSGAANLCPSVIPVFRFDVCISVSPMRRYWLDAGAPCAAFEGHCMIFSSFPRGDWACLSIDAGI